ncbi:family 10 glycosylhydrolase [Paenibacillus peoriae]|uniref:family 10 glycosylhydrolase n=1 Tax=Paenibacillus peoriae TaxID=59893 RepID=UPI00026C62F8|nr:family 10 glycosylhydrolase [Paenibacillus peoriae]MEC0180946.1 family 10 glycosylhydrolase [Paenibacillus peoriae]
MGILRKVSFIIITLITTQIVTVFASPYTQTTEWMKPKEASVLRAVWVSTIYNMDWPSKPGLSVAAQKREYLDMLDKLHAMGINTVFVQVRGASDAIYPSKY